MWRKETIWRRTVLIRAETEKHGLEERKVETEGKGNDTR